jgi:hypothetical protein
MNLMAHKPLPNIRKFFIPDPGYTICDSDLDRADLQVVVWEADDEDLKYALRTGIDLHILNGLALENIEPPDPLELVESHPNYLEHRERYARQRKLAKAFVHGTNYGGSARTMAIAAGTTVRQAELLQNRWFSAHPGIKEWHRRTEAQLRADRTVRNAFGFRRVFLDRPDGILPQALAWVPQSTVALYINMIWDAWVTSFPQLQVLMQVHDSLIWQYPTHIFKATIPEFRQVANAIQIPYADPLIIPVGFNFSDSNWGSCK